MRRFWVLTMAVLPLVLALGCGRSPAFEIDEMLYSPVRASAAGPEVTLFGPRPDSYAMVEVRGRLLEPGWEYERIDAQAHRLSLAPKFTLKPRFRLVKGDGDTDFVGYHTFGFDSFTLRESPMFYCGRQTLRGQGAPPSKTDRDMFGF